MERLTSIRITFSTLSWKSSNAVELLDLLIGKRSKLGSFFIVNMSAWI